MATETKEVSKDEAETMAIKNATHIAKLESKIASLKQDIELHERNEWQNEQWITTPFQLKTKCAELRNENLELKKEVNLLHFQVDHFMKMLGKQVQKTQHMEMLAMNRGQPLSKTIPQIKDIVDDMIQN